MGLEQYGSREAPLNKPLASPMVKKITGGREITASGIHAAISPLRWLKVGASSPRRRKTTHLAQLLALLHGPFPASKWIGRQPPADPAQAFGVLLGDSAHFRRRLIRRLRSTFGDEC